MKKIIVLCLTVILLAACLSGCGGEKALSGKEFQKIMEENGYVLPPVEQSFLDVLCEESYAYLKDEKERFYVYYRFSNEKKASRMMPMLQEYVKHYVDPESASFPEERTFPHEEYFSQKIAWGKAYFTRINNVVVFTGAPDANMEECERLLKEMGMLYEES